MPRKTERCADHSSCEQEADVWRYSEKIWHYLCYRTVHRLKNEVVFPSIGRICFLQSDVRRISLSLNWLVQIRLNLSFWGKKGLPQEDGALNGLGNRSEERYFSATWLDKKQEIFMKSQPYFLEAGHGEIEGNKYITKVNSGTEWTYSKNEMADTLHSADKVIKRATSGRLVISLKVSFCKM